MQKKFLPNSLSLQVVVIVVIILVVPLLILLYDSYFADKKEEVMFLATEERLGTIVQTVLNEVNANILTDEKKLEKMKPDDLEIYLTKVFSKAAEPLTNINSGVRLTLYIKDRNELVVKGFLHNYRQLSKEEKEEREKQIFDYAYTGIRSVLVNGQPIAAITGAADDRFFERLVPIKIGNKVVAVLWADERLHPIFNEAQRFRTMARIGSLIAFIIGGLFFFCFMNNLTNNVRRIKTGLVKLEEDLSNLLPDMPGEMGEISTAINKMAVCLAEKEKLEEEMRKQERLAALGQVVTGVAHELRNPLGIIKTTVQLLEEELKNPEFKEYCQVIKIQSDRQNRIIKELLAYGRPSKPFVETVQVNDLLESVLTFTSAQLRHKKINLEKCLSKNMPGVPVDSERIKQVFVNIILNAIESMPDGGKLLISTLTKKDYVQVSFADNGEGIEKAKLAKIFDPFFTTKDTGTGLGLTICNQIISMHEGKLDAVLNSDGGMTFNVKLPIDDQGRGEIK